MGEGEGVFHLVSLGGSSAPSPVKSATLFSISHFLEHPHPPLHLGDQKQQHPRRGESLLLPCPWRPNPSAPGRRVGGLLWRQQQ